MLRCYFSDMFHLIQRTVWRYRNPGCITNSIGAKNEDEYLYLSITLEY